MKPYSVRGPREPMHPFATVIVLALASFFALGVVGLFLTILGWWLAW